MQKDTFYTQDQLIQGIISHDTGVLEWLYQTQFPKVKKLVLENQGGEDQAKDLFQEAIISLWKTIKNGKFQPENQTALSGYLYQIAKNKWMDYLRSSTYKKTTLLDENLDFVHEEEETNWERYRQLVAKEWKILGSTCKEVLERFYFLKESLQTIASAFQWTEATARNNKYRCIQKLREKIQHQLKP